MTIETASITRNFLVEDDDLVDELLAAINQQGWSGLKMEYQFAKLSALRRSAPNNGSGSQMLTLAAEWTELDEEMQLRISISGETSQEILQRQCLAVMEALFAVEIYRRVNENN
jgi:hypothetical protein